MWSAALIMKKWVIGNPDDKISSELSAKSGLSDICASVLVSRGVDTIDKAKAFFGGGEDKLSDPFLIKDMQEAAERISAAIDASELICIYGDYDCDGITATAMLYSYIECMGRNVVYHVNMRDDGYGMCESAVKALADNGVKLIVTVDNGISAVKEAELAYKLGMELVITDHHQVGNTLPKAEAIVNPHRNDCFSPYKDLCGCGVALKLIAALDGGDYSSALEQFSDLAAIATIADIVPLNGENREIVIQGLHYLENTENSGLKALIECARIKKPISSSSVAFCLAPRINASGRLGSASDMVDLLLCDDYKEAMAKARKIDELNNRRKAAETEILDGISAALNGGSEFFDDVIVVSGKNWHCGVIGIVASRLVEKLGKPAFVISIDENEARGSARSVEGFSIFEALSECSELLTKFGGHEGAGGFSLEEKNIPLLREALNKFARNKYGHCNSMPVYSIYADKLLKSTELDIAAIKSLAALEPYGEKNAIPVFLLQNARLLEIIPVSNGAHTKIKISYGNKAVFGLLFGQKTDCFTYKAGTAIDILAQTEINSFNGSESVVLRICDIRRSGIKQAAYFNAKAAYEKYKRCGEIDCSLAARIIPSRAELGAVYRLIPKEKAIGCDELFFAVCAAGQDGFNYCKFKIAEDIFEELGLVKTDRFNDSLSLVSINGKVDLSTSKVLASLEALK